MTRLGEVAKLADCEHKTAPETPGGGYFAVGTPAMRENRIDLSLAREVSRDTYDAWTRRMRPADGDILLAREAPVGPAVFIREAGRIAPGQRTVLIRAIAQQINARYLYYLLIGDGLQGVMREMSLGSTVPHLNVSDVRALEIGDLPNPSTQRAIGEVLGALDDKIEANESVSNAAVEFIRALWGSITAGGVDQPLASVVELNPSVPKRALGSTFLEMKQLPEAGFSPREWSVRGPAGGARYRNGDTLMARITPCFENGKCGFVDFLPDGEGGTGSTEYIVLRPRDGVPSIVPYLIATDTAFRNEAAQHRIGTSGRQRVQAAALADIQVGWPSDDDLTEFRGIADPLVKRITAARNESQVLARARDELLPLLLAGKINVKDAERSAEEVL